MNLHFQPIQLNLEPRPGWWKVRTNEIIHVCKNVRKGHAEIIAETPGGYPVYAVFYGDFHEDPPQSNWSAASSSSSWKTCFSRRQDKQTVLFLAGIHGAEAESVCAAVNLIQMLETGTDFKGETDCELLSLADRYRFIIIPCANMDARAISPDHLRHANYHDFRAASQGIWKNGNVIEWRESKMYYPLPQDKVLYPGGYPNSEGFNIMHDACPGHIRTPEARGILQLCERWCVDFVLNGHSCEYEPSLIRQNHFTYPAYREIGEILCRKTDYAFWKAGLRSEEPKGPFSASGYTFNLNNMITFACGALCCTLECSVGASHDKCPFAANYTFEQLTLPPFIALKVIFSQGLETPFRQTLASDLK